MKKSFLILSTLYFAITGYSQTIQKSSIDSGGATSYSTGIDILYTIGEVNVQELNVGSIKLSEGFIGPELKVDINIIAFLQGPMIDNFNTAWMDDNLRTSGYLPTLSPYEDDATANASVFTDISGNNAIVDWVWVELRDQNDNTKRINGTSALLQRDGDIVGLDGLTNLKVFAAPNNYYVVVKHRNHLGIITNTPFQLSDNTTTVIDFSNPASPITFGSNAQTFFSAPDNVLAMWTGDSNQSGSVIFSGGSNDTNAIKDYILADPSNVLGFITFSSTGYLNQDLDLNGTARFSGSPNDSNIVKDNVLNHPNNVLGFPTFVITETVPPINN